MLVVHMGIWGMNYLIVMHVYEHAYMCYVKGELFLRSICIYTMYCTTNIP